MTTVTGNQQDDMAYHKDGFIHSVPEEVIKDIEKVCVYLFTGPNEPKDVLESRQRLMRYLEDYKKYNEV